MSVPILSIRDSNAIIMAAELINAGELVIVPTDTIYGIATLPDKEEAIHRLYRVRNRKPEPALPLLCDSIHYMKKLTHPGKSAQYLAQRFWPGPLTLILSPVIVGAPIALRVPNYPLLHPLFASVGGCLFTSGAILSGHSPAITAQEAADLFQEHVALILDGGPSPYGVPSTIVDAARNPPVLVRRGAVPEEKIREVLGDIKLATVHFQRR